MDRFFVLPILLLSLHSASAAEAPTDGQLRLRGTGRGGQNCGSTFFVVEEVPSPAQPPASDIR